MQFDINLYILTYIQGRQTSLLSRVGPGFMGFKELCPPCPVKFDSTCQMSRVLQSHENTTFLTMCKNVPTFQLWGGGISTAVGEPSIGR